MDKSILWVDRKLTHDKILVTKLVSEFVIGDISHLEYCTDKIMTSINSVDWQNTYKPANFVFLIEKTIGSYTSISMLFCCQILEVLYYSLGGSNPDEKAFDQKVRFVFKRIYNMNMCVHAADILRFIRNNIAHTIDIEGIESRRKPIDKDKVEKFSKEHGFDSIEESLRHLSGEFIYLIQQTCLIIMGLDTEDFYFNLRPPQHSIYFKKIIKSKLGPLDKS